MVDEAIEEETPNRHETVCWGCGLRVILPSYFPVFRCGWCGAITNNLPSKRKSESRWFAKWRTIRDRIFIFIVLIFMFFIIGGGLWVVHPIVFSISYLCGVIHFFIAGVLSICTVSTFLLSSLSSPGATPSSLWGDHSVVSKGSLEDFKFCNYCSRPKPPRAHHCRTCRMCVMDMDHHCPFIGNCVGGGNHRYFILFLISAVFSCLYITTMATFSWYNSTLLLLDSERVTYYASPEEFSESRGFFEEVFSSMINAALALSPRGLLVLYLGISSLSILIGVIALLSQQLKLIYDGETYLDRLTRGSGSGEKGCRNILRFFALHKWNVRIILLSSFHGRFLSRPGYSKRL